MADQQTSTSCDKQQNPPDKTEENIVDIRRPQFIWDFGPMVSKMQHHAVTYDPNAIQRVLIQIHIAMVYASDLEIPITQDHFIEVCRMIIFKRLCDVQENRTCRKVPGSPNILRHFNVPQPLGDLLFSIADYYDKTTGRYYDISPEPAPLDNVPAWREVDAEKFSKFLLTMKLIEDYYKTVKYPSKSEGVGVAYRSMIKEVSAKGEEQVLAACSTVTQSDALLKFCHEEFVTAQLVNKADCGFLMTIPHVPEPIILEYVTSYMKTDRD